MELDNGSILPSALFSQDHLSEMNSFNKTYSNLPLRVGIVKRRINEDSKSSVSQAYVEYDVLVYEQNENTGGAPTVYKNCIFSQGGGTVADFFEYTLRPQTAKINNANGIDAFDQDGALVLLLCINGYGDRGVILATLNHPNRTSTIVNAEKHLEGEFNGVNVKVSDDGSCVLSFKGATDSWGKPIDAKQGNTTVSIEKDGSVQIQNAGVTQRLEKAGNVSVTNTGNFSVASDKNLSISSNKGGVTLTSNSDNLIAAAKGDLTLDIKKAINMNAENHTIKIKSAYSLKAQQVNIEAEALAGIKAPTITMDGICFLGGKGGVPIPTLVSQYLGTSIAGPVLSVCVSGFSTKVFVT